VLGFIRTAFALLKLTISRLFIDVQTHRKLFPFRFKRKATEDWYSSFTICLICKERITSLKASYLDSVDSSGPRSNFTKDLQAIESTEHFINLALERLEINSLDGLDCRAKEKRTLVVASPRNR
jgi:hypothetical protein